MLFFSETLMSEGSNFVLQQITLLCPTLHFFFYGIAIFFCSCDRSVNILSSPLFCSASSPSKFMLITKFFYLLVHAPREPTQPALGQSKTKRQGLHLGLPRGCKSPNPLLFHRHLQGDGLQTQLLKQEPASIRKPRPCKFILHQLCWTLGTF